MKKELKMSIDNVKLKLLGITQKNVMKSYGTELLELFELLIEQQAIKDYKQKIKDLLKKIKGQNYGWTNSRRFKELEEDMLKEK